MSAKSLPSLSRRLVLTTTATRTATSKTVTVFATTINTNISPLSTQSRTFTSTTRCLVNPLLNLSHFSASKEAQFFSREKKMPREEFYPYLELIRSSEVDPFAPAAGATPSVTAALKRAERGQADMQTTYNLAIHNLIAQVQVARREAVQAHSALSQMQEKYRRDERNSGWIMLTGLALMTVVFVKTDAWDGLKKYAREIADEVRAFEWEWLGNPPPYRNGHSGYSMSSSSSSSSFPLPSPYSTQQQSRSSRQDSISSSSSSSTTMMSKPIIPIEAHKDSTVTSGQSSPASRFNHRPAEQESTTNSSTSSTVTPSLPPQQASSTGWRPTRLFWASPR